MNKNSINNSKVSIVVPVYNTENFLNQCVESLLNQTYCNIEIFLIDDGSTDSSLDICREWEQRDARISVFHKQNEGLGPTRNFGISRATGEFVLFLDSDDWLREDAIALIYDKIEEKNADIAFFDFVLFDMKKQAFERSYENAQYLDEDNFIPKKLKHCMLPSSCTSMYRLSKWREYGLSFPSCYYEDNGVYPCFLMMFTKYVIVPEGLYYYRVNAGKSITQNLENNFQRALPLKYLMEVLKNSEYISLYKEELYSYCHNQLSGSLELIKAHFSEERYDECILQFNLFLKDYFPGYALFKTQKFLYFGSYNIGRIGNNLCKHNINKDRYNFCSLISLMSERRRFEFKPSFENLYRQSMFLKEEKKVLLDELAKPVTKFLVMDLLEERLPLVCFDASTFITGTEEILQYLKENDKYSIIKRNTVYCNKLWEEHCLRFINFYNKYSYTVKIILIKLMLSETYGDENSKMNFSNLEEIKKVNSVLEAYYSFFSIHCPDIILIDPPKDLLYTDIDFKYGCKPEHYNNSLYVRVAQEISEKIKNFL